MIGLLWTCRVPDKLPIRMKTLFLSVLAVIVLMSQSSVTYAQETHNEDLRQFGDTMQIAIPLTGLAATAIYWDWEGAKQLGYTAATSIIITAAMKEIYGKYRPDLNGSGSFPSGHTSAAFFGAGFLDQRYGKWWGIPAYAAAAVTGYSRLDFDAHHTDDVLMGASVGLMSSWLWTTPYDGAVSLIPFQQGDGGGLMFSVSDDDKPDDYSGFKNDRWRYSILFGPAWQQENKIVSVEGVGTPVDLNTFSKTTDPVSTAIPMIEYYTDRHLFQFSLSPFEARDTGSVSQPTLVNGTTFLPTESLISRYRLTDWRLQYYYDVLPEGKIILEVGGGFSYQHLNFELLTDTSSKYEESKSDVFMPLVNAALGYQFNPRFSLTAELSGLSLNNQEQLDANISLLYRLSNRWDASIGYGIYKHDTEGGGLRNKVSYDILTFGVGFSWL